MIRLVANSELSRDDVLDKLRATFRNTAVLNALNKAVSGTVEPFFFDEDDTTKLLLETAAAEVANDDDCDVDPDAVVSLADRDNDSDDLAGGWVQCWKYFYFPEAEDE